MKAADVGLDRLKTKLNSCKPCLGASKRTPSRRSSGGGAEAFPIRMRPKSGPGSPISDRELLLHENHIGRSILVTMRVDYVGPGTVWSPPEPRIASSLKAALAAAGRRGRPGRRPGAVAEVPWTEAPIDRKDKPRRRRLPQQRAMRSERRSD
jgi:hypothetical protein